MLLSPLRRASVLVVVAVVATWAALAGGPPLLHAQVRREVRVGVVGLPTSLDPASALEGAVPLVARQIFDTLVGYRDGSTDIVPALATRWVASRDGLTWTFTLRDGVRFHDGAPVTAAEVAASFERRLKPDAAASVPSWTPLLRGVPGVLKEVRARDSRTVVFGLVQPYAPLLTVLAHPALSIVRAVGATDGSVRYVGSGPYRPVDVTPGRLALETVPGHWSGNPRAERLLFLEAPTDEHAEAELDAGGLDIWFPVGPPRRSDWALSIPGARVGYLAFQTEKEPFSRKQVRQAVAAALDPAVIGVALDRAGVPLQSFLPPGVWARREGSPVLGGTRDMVRRLLTEGAWPKGFTATMSFPGEPAPGLTRLAETLRAALGAVDIPVALRSESADTLRAMLQAGDHDMALVEGSVAGGDPHLLLYPLSTSEGASKGPRAANYSFYRNPRLDDVLIRASQVSFRPERARLYQRAQVLMAEEMPWAPLYVRLIWAVARPEVRGLRLHPTGFHRLNAVALEGATGQ